MNLKKISDSAFQIQVGNLNDYMAVINKVNQLENTKLSLDDFTFLTEAYPKGKQLRVTYGPQDNAANVGIQVDDDYFINMFFV